MFHKIKTDHIRVWTRTKKILSSKENILSLWPRLWPWRHHSLNAEAEKQPRAQMWCHGFKWIASYSMTGGGRARDWAGYMSMTRQSKATWWQQVISSNHQINIILIYLPPFKKGSTQIPITLSSLFHLNLRLLQIAWAFFGATNATTRLCSILMYTPSPVRRRPRRNRCKYHIRCGWRSMWL